MSYLVLARKYRPRQFHELVGQQHVAITLLNAFKQKKLGQAYLFTGTRGVGKTSVARIFAKSLRCENPDHLPGKEKYGTSCDTCPSCLEIQNGSSLDVLEIDGASNNGVENVREIREQVKFLPSRGQMKVYIIDEVHMLSNAAFNALLKTLEEPPAHVTFILATTEVQKIPATILSRCQRFDFKRVPQNLIYEHLLQILRKENIQSEAAAVRLIARKAEGSVRDSLSAMDQCLAMAGSELTTKAVTESLGLVGSDFLIDLLIAVFAQNMIKASTLIQQAYLNGVEIKQINIGLAETLRNAIYVKMGAPDTLAEVSEEERTKYEELTRVTPLESFLAAYQIFHKALEEIQSSPLPKASLEVTLARISLLSKLKPFEEIFKQFSSSSLLPSAAKAEQTRAPVGFEKKNEVVAPTATVAAAIAAPSSSAPPAAPASSIAHGPTASPTFQEFLSLVLQEKSSLGALLEHGINLTPDQEWPSAKEIRIGFRKNHHFYQMQAQHKASFDTLLKVLQSYLKRPAGLKIESIAGEAPQASLVETDQQNIKTKSDDKKKEFMAHEIVRNTKEIFGAELASFDIDKTKI